MDLALSPSGDRLVSSGMDAALRIWPSPGARVASSVSDPIGPRSDPDPVLRKELPHAFPHPAPGLCVLDRVLDRRRVCRDLHRVEGPGRNPPPRGRADPVPAAAGLAGAAVAKGEGLHVDRGRLRAPRAGADRLAARAIPRRSCRPCLLRARRHPLARGAPLRHVPRVRAPTRGDTRAGARLGVAHAGDRRGGAGLRRAGPPDERESGGPSGRAAPVHRGHRIPDRCRGAAGVPHRHPGPRRRHRDFRRIRAVVVGCRRGLEPARGRVRPDAPDPLAPAVARHAGHARQRADRPSPRRGAAGDRGVPGRTRHGGRARAARPEACRVLSGFAHSTRSLDR